MISYRSAVSAFAIRGTRGRRGMLLVYSALIAIAMLVIAGFISSRLAELGESVNALALADLFALFALGGALLIVAPAMVAANLAEERRSGTLDLLRTAPLSPTLLTLGFLSGAPGRLYLLLAGPFALHCVAGVLGIYPLLLLPQGIVVLAAGSVGLMLVAMLAVLTAPREGGGAVPMLIAGAMGVGSLLAVCISSDGGTAPWAFFHPAGALSVLYAQTPGLYQSTFLSTWQVARYAEHSTGWLLIEPLFAATVYALGGLILFVAARRALAGEPPARFTKHEAIALFGLAVMTVFVPLRVMISSAAIAEGYVVGVCVALCVPYAFCVIGATPSASGYGSGASARMSDRGSPFFAAALMLLLAVAISIFFYGDRFVSVAVREIGSPMLAFWFVALTFPIYTLFASTRMHTPATRLAFWAVITVHMCLQVPAWIVALEENTGGHVMGLLLAKLTAGFGLALPLYVAWRQRVGDRSLRVSSAA